MARLRYNGLTATLGGSLTNSGTSITFAAGLTHSGGTNVPTLSGSDYIPLQILGSTGHLSETVYLTAYTAAATTGTIVRGMEGTTGVSHSSGDKVTHGPTIIDMLGGSADVPPASPNAKDDEFDGTSSVTWTSTPTAPTSFDINTTRPSHAVMRSSGNGNNIVGKYQAVPGAYPYTITAKLAGQNARGASNRAGIFIAPASPTGASAVMMATTEVGATDAYWQRVLNSAFTGTFSSSNVGFRLPVTSGSWRDFGPIYFRIKVNSATSVDTSLSRDGWNFVTFESAFNPGFTPGVMGIFVAEVGTADLTAHFDFFRVT
jgi:hypothetical protein